MDERLRRLLELDLSGGRTLVLTHDNPDPDSLASAAAMELLLRERAGAEAMVAYSGIVGRAENRAMLRLLHLPATHVSDVDLDDFRYIALVDAQPHTGNSVLPADRVCDIVVDHHPLRESTRRARFYDVREELGASATLLTEYLQQAEIEIPQDLATALLYGIRSETQDLGREASPADLRAYQFLSGRADMEKLATISKPPLATSYFVQLSLALDSVRVGDGVAVCLLDSVTNPDFVPEMADFLVRMEEVEWTLVTGVYSEVLYVSIRSNDPDANAGELMQLLLAGIGRGGGHGLRGGGKVDLAGTATGREEIERIVEGRFLEASGANRARLAPLRTHHLADAGSST